MLKILKIFDAIGVVSGIHGNSKFGSLSYISFTMMTSRSENGNDLTNIVSDFKKSELLRIVMPIEKGDMSPIKRLKPGDKIKIKGLVCIDTNAGESHKDFIFLGTNLKLSG